MTKLMQNTLPVLAAKAAFVGMGGFWVVEIPKKVVLDG